MQSRKCAKELLHKTRSESSLCSCVVVASPGTYLCLSLLVIFLSSSQMAFSPLSFEDDLQCPVCCEVFSDPVVLDCSHSFCRFCLDAYWKDQRSNPCPVCRRKFPGRTPPANLALRNIVEVFKKQQESAGLKQRATGGERKSKEAGQRRRAKEEGEQEEQEGGYCSLHGERLVLYCAVERETICVVCQTGRKHKGHPVSPVEEAAPALREEVRAPLTPLRAKLQVFSEVQQECEKTAEYIEVKCTYNNHKESLTQKLSEPDPTLVTGALINVASHLGNLKYKVWEKMKEKCEFCPVILDPNTASPSLLISHDLTSVQNMGQSSTKVPANPERCHQSDCVLGAEPLGPGGTHIWEVEVGGRETWDIGVVRESWARKESKQQQLCPSNGYWALALRDGGRYTACTQLNPEISVSRKPSQVRVILDYEQGELSFYNATTMTLIYTFKEDSFTERLLPFFAPGSKAIKVASATAMVTIEP
ncbi:nuclear factor 7, ovary-like [Engraulis encrasicolus]|uniref:nuclear factor 7, ovary-like n=1 Tax=Engraulis encrasicolus TaxID=184585 RepID=UPI002FD1AD16